MSQQEVRRILQNIWTNIQTRVLPEPSEAMIDVIYSISHNLRPAGRIYSTEPASLPEEVLNFAVPLLGAEDVRSPSDSEAPSQGSESSVLNTLRRREAFFLAGLAFGWLALKIVNVANLM